MPRAAVVCGLGSYLPEAVLSNDMLAAELDTSDAWISSRTGVRQRHIAGDLGSGDLALRAASAALASAGLERVDAVVLATSTGDFCCPATAPRVAARLGLVGALAFDLSAACTGFVYGPGQRRLADQRRAGGQRAAGRGGHFQPYPRPRRSLDPRTVRRRRRSGGAACRRCRGRRRAAGLRPRQRRPPVRPADDPAVSRAERSSGQASTTSGWTARQCSARR